MMSCRITKKFVELLKILQMLKRVLLSSSAFILKPILGLWKTEGTLPTHV